MGWSSGSEIMNRVIAAVKPHVTDFETRKSIYTPIIEALEDGDWDTQDESVGEDDAFDSALKDLHPSWYDEESDD